ncbi:zinc finger protein 135-like [Chrysoperla carnea]|uniref:zinc finger protein 135-like n=1 Tax=Chrysoperla carnea TaxID=189513 RepID=UPI001D093FBB|nr:zinc finger protein 135-like [Chrysoperla carnea]
MNLLINNVDIICRVCLNSNIDLHNIFTKNESSYTIAFSLMECAPVEIAPDDGLPHQICTECAQKVQYVQQFKNQIISSDTTLRQYIQNYNDTKPDVDYTSEPVDVTPDIHMSYNDIHVKEEDSHAGDDDKSDLKPIKPMKKRKTKKKKIVTDDILDEFDVKVPRIRKPRKQYDRRVGGPFKCDQCDRTCTTKGNLSLHKRTHTGEKPHMCDFCGKSFAWSSYLISHRRTHTGEYPYQCDFCSKRFVRITEYKDHRRIHTGERPYKCDGCDKSFKQNSQLRVHKRIHAGIFNFECDTCNKRFKTKYVMIKHKRIHTGERPYECPICYKKFSQNASLFNHNRLVHKISSTRPVTLEAYNLKLEKDLMEKANV